MGDKDLEQIMATEWQEARKGFHYPQLPYPKLVENIPNGSIDISSMQIQVSEPFIKGFKQHGIQESEAMNEVLTHELLHFMKYPGSVLNVLRLQKAAQGITDGNKISELRQAFTEVQTNLYMVNEKKHPATAKMRKAHGLTEGDTFGRIMYGLYQEASGQDFGVKLAKEEKSLVDKLKEIPFSDKESELDNFREFARIMKDYQPPQQQNKDGSKQNKEGEGQEQRGQGEGNNANMFTNNQLREGLRQFAQECDSPEEYQEIVSQVLQEKEKGEEREGFAPASGIHAGTDRGITLIASSLYSALAEKYSIPIRKRPLHKNGGLHPHSHKEFSVSDSISEVDPFSAPGILPGITKKWVRKEGEVHSDCEAVPNSILVVDNSPSMFQREGENHGVPPNQRVYPHIVGATAIANAYLDNDGKVAVYSFGSRGYFVNFTREKDQVHEALRIYSLNGGTTFNPKFLEETLKQNEETFDISVVSDMEISNLDRFVSTVLGIPQTHRVHLLYTNPQSGHLSSLRETFGKSENVAILPITSDRDIPYIVMGELKKSVR